MANDLRFFASTASGEVLLGLRNQLGKTGTAQGHSATHPNRRNLLWSSGCFLFQIANPMMT